jgi:GT2 family glycosyltransferase
MKLPNALNIGFQKATGDYYTWTSDDNLYKPYAIETLVEEIEHNTDVLMVYSDYTEIDFDGKLLNKIKLQNPEHMVLGNVFGACFLYSAQIAKKIGGYDPELFLAEDYDYWIRIYKHGRIIHIPQNLYFYRRHTESLSETKKAYIDEQTYKAIEKNFFLLYVTAKRYSLEFDFFNEMLKRGQAHANKTKRLLMILNRRYYLYLMWISLKKSLHGTVIHKVYHKLKRKR